MLWFCECNFYVLRLFLPPCLPPGRWGHPWRLHATDHGSWAGSTLQRLSHLGSEIPTRPTGLRPSVDQQTGYQVSPAVSGYPPTKPEIIFLIFPPRTSSQIFGMQFSNPNQNATESMSRLPVGLNSIVTVLNRVNRTRQKNAQPTLLVGVAKTHSWYECLRGGMRCMLV